MKQWQYAPEEGDHAISEVGTDEVVLYTNDVHPEVIAHLVQMHNEEYSLRKIKDYLESDERVTPDEVEFLMEELEKYEEMEKTAGIEKEPPFPLNLDEQKDPTPTKEELIEKATTMTKEETSNLAESIAQIQQPVEQSKNTRGKRGTGNKSGKKLSLEDMIQEMESKIELARVFQNIPEIPFPENMSKSARDLMLRFQKEYKELVEKFVTEIQDM